MKTNYTKLFLGACAMLATLASPPASAKLLWQDFSLSLLSGSNYEKQAIPGVAQTQAASRHVVSFEHASGHTWGGTFLFIDRLMSQDSDFANDALYGELNISPNIAKPGGFIKNVFIAPQWEFGSGDNGKDNSFNPSDGNSFNNFLLGFGVGLDVPGASYFNVALYKRFNDDQTLDTHLPTRDIGRSREDNEQLTVTWRFDFADDRVRFDGFLDVVTSFNFKHKDGSKSEASSGYNFTPQLKFDLGRTFGMEAKKLWAGTELVYWKNKFGVKDWDESNFNFLLKWHF